MGTVWVGPTFLGVPGISHWHDAPSIFHGEVWEAIPKKHTNFDGKKDAAMTEEFVSLPIQGAVNVLKLVFRE